MKWWLFGLAPTLLSLVGCSLIHPSPAQVVSVSDDGRYVVSSHTDNRLILWDTQRQGRSVISRNANIYSAYFIDGGEAFLWQDLDDVVHVQSVDGEVVESFAHFPTYGHVMGSDLATYFASDVGFRLYKGWGEHKEPMKTDSEGGKFRGTLLNLELHESRGLLFSVAHAGGWDELAMDAFNPLDERRSSRFDGPFIWDVESGEPLFALDGLYGKAHGDISPDGRYVIATGDNHWGYMWETATGERRWQMVSYYLGQPRDDVKVPEGKELAELPVEELFDQERLIDLPEDATEGHEGRVQQPHVAALFIDESWYVRISHRSRYAALNHIDDPYHSAFLDLGTSPFPGTERHIPSIDAAPAANVLVTGQRRPKGGINVYRFDPDEQTLEQVWSPRGWFAF